jgi:chemotaxis protein methyltransferase CheR
MVMGPELFRLIRDFAAEEFGLVLGEGKEQYLALKLSARLEELRLASFTEYYHHLKFSLGGPEEQLKFISLITNNETYFFREERQLSVFAEHILPALKERKLKEGNRRLRIVSAGCSSGEEVYTLAMLLLESGLFLWEWDLSVVGLDIDPLMVDRARAGVYSGRAFQSMPPRFRERYFTRCGEGEQVREVVRNLTSFQQGNLISFDRLFSPGSVDVIFCRNVLIYFDDATIGSIIGHFQKTLVPGGFLCLGHSESLSRIPSDCSPLCFPGSIIYQYGGKG